VFILRVKYDDTMDLKIVDELRQTLEQSPSTHAMWIAGSVAEGYADEFSDVDLWLDIDDGQDKATFNAIETFLRSKGGLDVNYTESMSSPFTHKVYHLVHMDPYHFIEVTLHSHSHNYEFIEGVRKVKVLFDKDGTTTFKPLDTASHTQMLQDRKQFLTEKMELGELSVKKEIARGQFMDALHNYQFWLVEPVIELARIKHAPLKISYGLKHGSRDLPKDIVAAIESLYTIASLEDLRSKIKEVKALANKLDS
jgi:predicted nucleotidyltransferase